MREFLFRGKLSHNNKWLIGNLVFSQEGTPYIIPSRIIEQDGHHLKIFDDNAYWVNNDTIGQYIGLKDRNKVKIFEGDICIRLDIDNYPRPLVVEWVNEFACFAFVDKGDYNKMYFFQERHMDDLQIIGNIYDNENIIK